MLEALAGMLEFLSGFLKKNQYTKKNCLSNGSSPKVHPLTSISFIHLDFHYNITVTTLPMIKVRLRSSQFSIIMRNENARQHRENGPGPVV